MYNTAKKQVWYGELRTPRGTSIVVHDNRLPDASPGRIYLFNVSRNTIGEYVEDIVKVNLHELEPQQLTAAKAEHEAAWLAARAEFMAKHEAHIELSSVPDSAPASKAKKVAAVDEIIDVDVDDSEMEFEDADADFGISDDSDD
ncbi:hypothetical protein BCU94_06820 [Shewanella sp. 10N.286.52.C2]|uniref:hypothetical protein n=1 Tax=unclassified Shewanella TaxID=196818 RepID=UPI000C82611E|nr:MULTISPECIES: hypothetical protein [unclassified Shewanella]MDO6775508.1 hypothetical protein [Shewanella sp. 3_MG-2023]PMG31881.1 hypothetical protein BCU94_06820 [Shewanella sp. 10N.286.52.C2]